MKRSQFDDSRDQRISTEAAVVRTDYSCQAHGCPNAGSIDRGVCYYHWRADPSEWHAVTQEIRENFERMRNWGKFSPEVQAEHHAASQRRFGSPHRKPTGLQSGAA